MKIYHCGHYNQLAFYENTTCVNCGHVLAYLPDQRKMGTIESDGGDLWRSLSTESARKRKTCGVGFSAWAGFHSPVPWRNRRAIAPSCRPGPVGNGSRSHPATSSIPSSPSRQRPSRGSAPTAWAGPVSFVSARPSMCTTELSWDGPRRPSVEMSCYRVIIPGITPFEGIIF
jgi:hypothetical protein